MTARRALRLVAPTLAALTVVATGCGFWTSDPELAHGAEVAEINCPGITWKRVEASGDPNVVQVFFDEVEVIDGQPNLLAFNVSYEAAADENIGRCIVGSVDWKLG